MTLACEFHPPIRDGHDGVLLVALHGLWGDKSEFSPIADALRHWAWLGIDLPGHGQSKGVQVNSLAQTCERVCQALAPYASFRLVLLGYSLGARVAQYGLAMQLWPDNLLGVIAEGGHLGLTSESERKQRAIHDHQWAERFCRYPIETVLAAWYRQNVFATLSCGQRRALIERRKHNDGRAVAQMLLATSLATQPNLGPYLSVHQDLLHVLCGANDQTFCRLYTRRRWPFSTLANAGHNAHRDNPQGFASLIHGRVTQWVRGATVSEFNGFDKVMSVN